MSENPTDTAPLDRPSLAGLLIRAGLFLLFIRILGGLLGWLLNETVGYFPAAAGSIFIASVLASWGVLRVFERGRFEDLGLGWSTSSKRHLIMGLLGGAGTSLAVVAIPLLLRVAELHKIADTESQFTSGRLIFVLILLLFGAVGEELMFRGYAFQLVIRALGPRIAIPSFALLFAAAHSGNLNSSNLGLINTGLWGLVLCYAFHRSGDLWLPIGLHYGWNLVLPLFGANLSGFTMSVSGYEVVWTAGRLWSGGSYGPEASLLTTIATLSLGFWLWKTPIQRQSTLLLPNDSMET